MTKIFGLHEIELRQDVDPDEYARFLAEEFATMPTMEGWKVHILRGDRGVRQGKFALLFEIESEDARNRYFPTEEHDSEEFKRYLAEHPDMAAVVQRKTRYEAEERMTDYRVLDA